MPNFLSHDTILVPQGAEYQAVCRGLRGVTGSIPTVLPIPVGMQPLLQYLQQSAEIGQILAAKSRVLIVGLCGSLSDRYSVGDVVLYQNCLYQGKRQECDRSFTAQLHSALGMGHGAWGMARSRGAGSREQRGKTLLSQSPVPSPQSLVNALTSDRVISSAAEKRHLGETLAADVVDMEGFTALEFFNAAGVAVAMLRVVSDDCQHDIPDLTTAIDSDGSLRPLPLAMAMIRQPVAATRLIRGSLTALKVLEKVTNQLFKS
ncbi:MULTISPECIES: phosphorylase [Nostoc]|uniref:Phosphorylase n=1 Tax=Nostoc paludosum FACHB-159 TaxID=2692908 RepID=A0ABR8K4T9_9NOSO|nr:MULTISPECIES: phosphorylase [Nostoc]MBD2678160.1 phosphorylase [Nostoc sp. FACHB-857]MBD2734420.1 phosphorylase [Nostoc paludosum FACHB-159]